MADIIGSEDKEKSIYLMEIKYVDELLERRQLQCDEMKRQNKHLASQFTVLQEDRKDIAEHLKRCVAAEERRAEEVAERLEGRQQAAERDAEALKLQLGLRQQELQDRIHELESGIRTLARKLEEQPKLAEQLVQQRAVIESLKEQLVSQREEHVATMASPLQDFDELWASEERENPWESYVSTAISNIFHEETDRVSGLDDEVEDQAQKNLRLWMEMSNTENYVKRLHKGIDDIKDDMQRFTRECCMHSREVEWRRRRCRLMKVKLEESSSTTHEDETVRQSLPSASEVIDQQTAEEDQLRAELQEEGSRRRRLEAVMQEAVLVLSRILTDSQKHPKTRGRMLRLLETLESTAPQRPGSTPAEESSQGQKPQTRAQTLDLDTDPLFLMARYRPGDLGFIPRPMWKHKPAVSRTGGRPAQLLLNRKRCSLNTSSSDPEASSTSTSTSPADSSHQ